MIDDLAAVIDAVGLERFLAAIPIFVAFPEIALYLPTTMQSR